MNYIDNNSVVKMFPVSFDRGTEKYDRFFTESNLIDWVKGVVPHSSNLEINSPHSFVISVDPQFGLNSNVDQFIEFVINGYYVKLSDDWLKDTSGNFASLMIENEKISKDIQIFAEIYLDPHPYDATVKFTQLAGEDDPISGFSALRLVAKDSDGHEIVSTDRPEICNDGKPVIEYHLCILKKDANTNVFEIPDYSLSYYEKGVIDGGDLTEETLCSHDVVEYLEAVPPTCGSHGWTAGRYCKTCGKTLSTPKYIPSLQHERKVIKVVAPTCTTYGYTLYKCITCGDEYESDIVKAYGHTEEIIPGKAATCTEPGLTDGKKCSVCGNVIEAQVEIETLEHNWIPIPGKDATCTEPGLTAGEKCSVCGEVSVEHEVIKALGHTEETIAGKDATCTETGLTEGKKCSVCGEILAAQEVIPRLTHIEGAIVMENEVEDTCNPYLSPGYDEVNYCTLCNVELSRTRVSRARLSHTEIDIPGYDATCTTDGLTTGHKCSVCGVITLSQEVIDAPGHVEEIIYGKDVSCTEDGLTAGKKCSVCGEILVSQEVIEALGHSIETVAGKTATCTESGLTEKKFCTRCGEILVKQEVIPATGHTVVVDPAVAATCTDPGLTEGEHCSVCGEVLKAQVQIATADHEWVTIPGKEATCTETGWTEGECCAVCGEVSVEQEEIELQEHEEVIIPGTEATETELGLTEGKKCSVCGKILIPQYSIPRYLSFTLNEDGKTCAVYIPDGMENELPANTTLRIPSTYTTNNVTYLVTDIPEHSFWECPELTQVIIPDSITSIGFQSFEGCTGLSSIVIGTGVEFIDKEAFANCTNLNTVYYTGTEEQWKKITIDDSNILNCYIQYNHKV